MNTGVAISPVLPFLFSYVLNLVCGLSHQPCHSALANTRWSVQQTCPVSCLGVVVRTPPCRHSHPSLTIDEVVPLSQPILQELNGGSIPRHLVDGLWLVPIMEQGGLSPRDMPGVRIIISPPILEREVFVIKLDSAEFQKLIFRHDLDSLFYRI